MPEIREMRTIAYPLADFLGRHSGCRGSSRGDGEEGRRASDYVGDCQSESAQRNKGQFARRAAEKERKPKPALQVATEVAEGPTEKSEVALDWPKIAVRH